MVFVPGLCGRGGVTNYRHIFPGFLLGASGFSGASGASAKASVVELAKQSGKKERNGLRNAVRRPLPLKTTLSGVFYKFFYAALFARASTKTKQGHLLHLGG